MVNRTGTSEPQDGDSPISGRSLSAYGVTAAPITIATPPASQTVLEPAPATFSVVAAGFPPPTSYQWLRNGVPIPGRAPASTAPELWGKMTPMPSRTANGIT